MGAAIAATAPALGFGSAVRWTTLGVGAAAGGVGIGCLLVANAAPDPVSPGEAA